MGQQFVSYLVHCRYKVQATLLTLSICRMLQSNEQYNNCSNSNSLHVSRSYGFCGSSTQRRYDLAVHLVSIMRIFSSMRYVETDSVMCDISLSRQLDPHFLQAPIRVEQSSNKDNAHNSHILILCIRISWHSDNYIYYL